MKLQALQQMFYTFLSRMSKKEKIIFYIAATAVSLTLLDRLIVSPVFSRINSLNKQITEKKTEIKKNLRIVAQKDKITKEKDKFDTFLIDPKTSEDERITAVLKEIENLANKSSVYLVEMKPATVKDTDASKKILINLNCEAQTEQIVEFLYAIESSNYLLSIEKYQMTPKSKDSSVVKCSMSVYKVIVL